MVSRKGTISAKELQQQLQANPEYQKMMREKEIQNQLIADECAKDEEELVKAINQQGIHIESVWDLVNNVEHPFLENNFTGPYEKVYPILIEHLDKPHHKRIRDGIIRALSEKGAKELAKDKLLEHFNTEQDRSLKWVLANALNIVLSRGERKKHPQIDLVLKRLV